jgi:hypothetical protein
MAPPVASAPTAMRGTAPGASGARQALRAARCVTVRRAQAPGRRGASAGQAMLGRLQCCIARARTQEDHVGRGEARGRREKRRRRRARAVAGRSAARAAWRGARVTGSRWARACGTAGRPAGGGRRAGSGEPPRSGRRSSRARDSRLKIVERTNGTARPPRAASASRAAAELDAWTALRQAALRALRAPVAQQQPAGMRRRSSVAPARSRAMSYADALCLAWFALDAFTHLVIEGSYVALALGPTAAASKSPFGAIWREYGRADARWARRDARAASSCEAVAWHARRTPRISSLAASPPAPRGWAVGPPAARRRWRLPAWRTRPRSPRVACQRSARPARPRRSCRRSWRGTRRP